MSLQPSLFLKEWEKSDIVFPERNVVFSQHDPKSRRWLEIAYGFNTRMIKNKIRQREIY